MHPLVWEVHLQKDRRTTCVFWFLLALLGFWHPAHCKITFLLFFHSLYFLSWDSMNVSGLKTNSIHFQPEKFLLLDLKYVDCLELHLVSSVTMWDMPFIIAFLALFWFHSWASSRKSGLNSKTSSSLKKENRCQKSEPWKSPAAIV